MKTSVTIPDAVFHRAEALATSTGISRDELYAKALKSFLKRAADEGVTARIDAALAAVPSAEQADPFIQAAAETMLREVEW